MRGVTRVFTNTRSASCQKVLVSTTTGNSVFFLIDMVDQTVLRRFIRCHTRVRFPSRPPSKRICDTVISDFLSFRENLNQMQTLSCTFLVLRTVVIEHAVDNFFRPIILGFRNNMLLDAKTFTRSSLDVVTWYDLGFSYCWIRFFSRWFVSFSRPPGWWRADVGMQNRKNYSTALTINISLLFWIHEK